VPKLRVHRVSERGAMMDINLPVGMDVDVVDFYDAKRVPGDRGACACERPRVASRTDLDQIATTHHSIDDEPLALTHHRPIRTPSRLSTLAANRELHAHRPRLALDPEAMCSRPQLTIISPEP
jgi:hypothetical protein